MRLVFPRRARGWLAAYWRWGTVAAWRHSHSHRWLAPRASPPPATQTASGIPVRWRGVDWLLAGAEKSRGVSRCSCNLRRSRYRYNRIHLSFGAQIQPVLHRDEQTQYDERAGRQDGEEEAVIIRHHGDHPGFCRFAEHQINAGQQRAMPEDFADAA